MLRCVCMAMAAALLVTAPFAVAEEEATAKRLLFTGQWVINEELSGDTDKQVERAIKAGGGKVKRGKKEKGHYRGGPDSQKLYDHISYDEQLSIEYNEPRFTFSYEKSFNRVFYSDGRSRSFSSQDAAQSADFSFAEWEGDTLYVESTAADAGRILETYTLLGEGRQLRLDVVLEPASFVAPIELLRVFDRGAVEQ